MDLQTNECALLKCNTSLLHVLRIRAEQHEHGQPEQQVPRSLGTRGIGWTSALLPRKPRLVAQAL